jgi:hypothetical protein
MEVCQAFIRECKPGKIPLCNLILAGYRDAGVSSERLQSLSTTEKDYHITLVRQTSQTRELTFNELLRKVGLGHVYNSIILKTLNSQDMKINIKVISRM